MTHDPSFANELLRMLETGNYESEGANLNDLASQFRRGFPIDRLRPALRSENPKTVESAMYVACELGSRVVPLVDDMLPFTTMVSIGVKYRICDVCLFAIPQDTRLVPAVSRYLIEESFFVRFHAIRVFLKMDESLLFETIQKIRTTIPATATATESEDQSGNVENAEIPSRLLHVLWLILTLRSSLSYEVQKQLVGQDALIEPELKDAIIKLILGPKLKREKRIRDQE